MPQLIFYVENDYPQIHELPTGTVSIGRNKDNDIAIHDSRVSVYHAEINREKGGPCEIADLDSQNGTFVNGKKIDRAVLCPGDKLKFGAVKAVFEASPNGEKSKILEREIDEKATKLYMLEKAIREKTGFLSGKIEELESKSAKLKKQKEDEKNNLLAIRKQLETAHQKTGHLQFGMEARKKELDELQNQRSKLDAEYQKLRESTASAEKQKEEQEARLSSLRKQIETASAELKEKQQASLQIGDVEAKSKAAEEKLARLESNLAAGETRFSELQNTLESTTAELEEKQQAVNEADAAEAELEELKLELDKREAAYRDIQINIASATEELEEKLRASQNADAALEKTRKIEAKLNLIETELKHRQIGLGEIEKNIAAATTILEEKHHASRDADALIEKAKSFENQLAGLEAELKNRESSREEITRHITELESEREKLHEEIAKQTETLNQLTNSLETTRNEASQIDAKMRKSEEFIRISAAKIAEMETNLSKSRDALTRSESTQKTLVGESRTLSRIIGEKSAVLQRIKDKILSARNGTGTTDCPPLRVIKPGMRSLVHYFHQGAGVPDKEDRIVPIGLYGLAACTGGSMHREADTIPPGNDPVLLLLDGDTEKDREWIDYVSTALPDRIILVCWPEGQLDPPSLSSLPKGIHGVVSVDNRTAELYDEHQSGRPHLRIPLPCPLEVPEWNLSARTLQRKRGIFVATDGYDPDSPVHLDRIKLLRQFIPGTQKPVTLHRSDPANTFPALPIPKERLTQTTGPMDYIDYLTLMGEHSLITGFGKNQPGGDVTGDALLARAVFFGGDASNTIDELLFPETCIKEGDLASASKNAIRLLSDQVALSETVERSQNLAPQLISFESVRERIGEFLQFISANPGGV